MGQSESKGGDAAETVETKTTATDDDRHGRRRAPSEKRPQNIVELFLPHGPTHQKLSKEARREGLAELKEVAAPPPPRAPQDEDMQRSRRVGVQIKRAAERDGGGAAPRAATGKEGEEDIRVVSEEHDQRRHRLPSEKQPQNIAELFLPQRPRQKLSEEARREGLAELEEVVASPPPHAPAEEEQK